MFMNHLVPSHKDDQRAIRRLQIASPEQVLALAPELLEWVQDGNWPVAHPIIQVLRPLVNQLQDALLPILQGNDAIWKMWCICAIIAQAPVSHLAPAYLGELARIVEHPTFDEEEEGAHEAAQDALAYWQTKE